MKNLVKSSLLVVGLLMSFYANASNGKIKIEKENADSKVIHFTFENHDGQVKIVVKDDEGIQLHSESMNTIHIEKRYDLSNLPKGHYDIEIEGETRSHKFAFEILEKGLELKKGDKLTFKPVVRQDNDRLFISKFSLVDGEMMISLQNDDMDEIYSEKIVGNASLVRILDVSKLKKGSYTLFLESNGKSYMKKVKI